MNKDVMTPKLAPRQDVLFSSSLRGELSHLGGGMLGKDRNNIVDAGTWSLYLPKDRLLASNTKTVWDLFAPTSTLAL